MVRLCCLWRRSMKIAVLMTCHNRREAMERCLGSLMAQLGDGDRVFLVDDGSEDGTDAAAKAIGGAKVHLILANGSFYWARGMRTAWDVAGDGWDGYLWLNDDTELDADAVERLVALAGPDRVVVGDLKNAKGEKTYGLREDGVFSGNVVLVPREVVGKVGGICGAFKHAWADVDFALRCRRAGVKAVGAGCVGRAEGHPLRPELKGKTLKERWRLLFDPKGWNLHDAWLYRRRNWGIFAATGSCLHLVWHVLRG